MSNKLLKMPDVNAHIFLRTLPTSILSNTHSPSSKRLSNEAMEFKVMKM